MDVCLVKMLSSSSDCVRGALQEEEETERRGGIVGGESAQNCNGSEVSVVEDRR
jgi:hypothetical protein